MSDAPKPVGPYSPIVRAGDFLYVSGQIAMRDGELIGGGAAAQTTQALANLVSVLETEGAKLTDVVKTTIFCTDMGEYPTINEAYAEGMGEHRPARATVAVAGLPAGAQVEIEAVAYLPV